MKRVVSILALPLMALFGACSRLQPAGEGGGAALMRNLLRAKVVEIVVRPGPAVAACSRAAERIARERRVECRVLSLAQRGDPRAARIVVGGPEDELAASLLARLGLKIGGTGGRPSFAWRRDTYAGASDALFAVLEDPERPGLPLTLLYGNDDAALARYAASLEPGWKPWIRIYRTFDLALEAPLWEDGALVESRVVDAAAARTAALAGFEDLPARKDLVSVRASREIDPAIRGDYLEAIALARQATVQWAGVKRAKRPLALFLHARPESFALCAGGASLAAWRPLPGEVHALLARGVPHDAGIAVARALAEDLLGPPASPWIGDGAALHAARRWWGRDLDEWIGWLRAGGLAPSAAALVDPQAVEASSPHLILPLRAALFRFLLESRGEVFVRELWAGRSALSLDTELEKSFGAWLDDLAARRRVEIEARHAARRGALLDPPFLAGVGIEEPGSASDHGFGSAAFEESLREARAIGAGAVALTCYFSGERDPAAVPDITPERALAPFEGDLRVFCGLCQARASGMRALLQMHLLTGPAGSLAGLGPQAGEAGWQRFFDGYARFAVHAALLCELADAEGLALGGGMTESTSKSANGRRSVPGESGWRREGWSKVVRAARGAFSGSLTWGADCLLEARELSFWDDLDVVGCDLEEEIDERALHGEGDPGLQLETRIGNQLSALSKIAQEHGKPLILTRAGFKAGAPRPSAPRGSGATGEVGLQAMQFEVLAKALRRARDGGSLHGAILWRWSSDPSDPGLNGHDRLLRPGPAREAAARAFQGL